MRVPGKAAPIKVFPENCRLSLCSERKRGDSRKTGAANVAGGFGGDESLFEGNLDSENALTENKNQIGIHSIDRPMGFPPGPAFEAHFTPVQISKLWGLSVDKIRDVFEREPGVVMIDNAASRKKRRYRTMLIPRSVVEKVHSRLVDRRAHLQAA